MYKVVASVATVSVNMILLYWKTDDTDTDGVLVKKAFVEVL